MAKTPSPRDRGTARRSLLDTMCMWMDGILNENAENAVLDGGPLDGREHRVKADSAELLVVMEDGSEVPLQCVRPSPEISEWTGGARL